MQRLPLDRLKIDRAFVRGLISAGGPSTDVPAFIEDRSQALVDTIVTLAHNLGLEAVAEGVEEAEQVQSLRDLGCDQAQGYVLHGRCRLERSIAY